MRTVRCVLNGNDECIDSPRGDAIPRSSERQTARQPVVSRSHGAREGYRRGWQSRFGEPVAPVPLKLKRAITVEIRSSSVRVFVARRQGTYTGIGSVSTLVYVVD